MNYILDFMPLFSNANYCFSFNWASFGIYLFFTPIFTFPGVLKESQVISDVQNSLVHCAVSHG